MSSILPKSAVERVTFFENHTADWSSNAVAIGSSAAAVTLLTTRTTTTARAAFNAQQLAQEQAKAATQNFRDAVRAMTSAGVDIIQQVKARAATDGNSIYTLALLPVPAVPAPIPAPGIATNFVVELSQGGTLTLKWKCANPVGSQGTMYQVSRRTGTTGPVVIVGATGNKHFADDTVPAGTASVTYRIIAIRSTAQGPEALFTVNLGVSGAGEMIASVVSVPKLAA